jgi:DNA repair exonuclease SbcCD ATPase subunit
LSSEDGGRLLLAGASSVEIAHEALITQWPWLRTEGQKFGLDIDELSRLMEKAKAWAKEATDIRPKYLATGAELETFAALAERRKDWLSDKEREFVAACRAREVEEKEREEQRQKRELEEARKLAEAQKKVAQRTLVGLIVASVLLVGALGAAWFGFNRANRAQEQSAVADERKKDAAQQRAIDRTFRPRLLRWHSLNRNSGPWTQRNSPWPRGRATPQWKCRSAR